MKSFILKIRPKNILLRPLFSLFIILILFSLAFFQVRISDSGLNYDGKNISISGKIREIEYNEDNSVKSIVVGEVLCYVNSPSALSLHDEVSVSGTAKAFKTPMNTGEFNQKAYYMSKKVCCYVNSANIKILRYSDCPVSKLCKLKLSAVDKVNTYCKYENGTINTLIPGDKRFLNDSRKNLYQLAGISHFLVISGLHISAIGAFIYKMTARIFKKRPIACVISMAFLIVYGIFAGFGVSVIRAIVMYCTKLVSYIFKRSYDMLSAISLAGIITLISNPLMVKNNAFIFSYTTVIFIALYIEFLGDTVSKHASLKKRFWYYIKFPILLSMFLGPVSMYLTYSYAPLSALVNIILLSCSAPILLIAAFAFISSIMNLGSIALMFDVMLTFILKPFDVLCKLTTSIPGAIVLGKPKLFLIILYYLLVSFVLYLHRSKNLSLSMVVGAIPILFVVLIAPGLYIPQVTMLYVGQGDCMVIKTTHNSAVIMDCGSSSEKDFVKYTVIPYLKASGISRIDAVYASHSDIDHINGIDDLIENAGRNGIKLCKLFIPNTPLFYDEEGTALVSLAYINKISTYALTAGDSINIAGWNLACLWPTSNYANDSNSDSMVTYASLHNFNILITGDITKETEKKLLDTYKASYLNKCDVLKIPHHGSKTASSEEFLKVVEPKYAIISSGIKNSYGHPHSETLNRLKTCAPNAYVLRTDIDGQVTVSSSLTTPKAKRLISGFLVF